MSAIDARDIPMRIRGAMDEAVLSATGQLIEALARYACAKDQERFTLR